MQITPLMRSILEEIERNGGVLEGTETLTLSVTTANAKAKVISAVRKLRAQNIIIMQVSRGGRGNKTNFKLNRNSPGLPRKRRHHVKQ